MTAHPCLSSFQSLLHQGISLLLVVPGGGRPAPRGRFQSLLHQGISLLLSRRSPPPSLLGGFQSLLHQGISLLNRIRQLFTEDWGLVSIPSSSGHQFTDRRIMRKRRWLDGFNPFFIRASVYCPETVSPVDARMIMFQSLLHQGISLLFQLHFQFGNAALGLFQSLLHQGISLLQSVLSRSAASALRFQSLLHQGISLLLLWRPRSRQAMIFVSIPSSSGHQFTGRSEVGMTCRNS